MAGTRAPPGPHRRLSTRSEQRWNPARTLHGKATDGCLASSPMDVVAQFDRQRPARLSLIARCSGFVAILNARRADRFLRRATPWLSHKELVLLLRGAFVQMKRENHGSKHRTLWETLSTALRKLAGRECLPCRAYELVRPT